jgi:hypothetical protein
VADPISEKRWLTPFPFIRKKVADPISPMVCSMNVHDARIYVCKKKFERSSKMGEVAIISTFRKNL